MKALPGDSYVVPFWQYTRIPDKQTDHNQKELHRSLQVDTTSWESPNNVLASAVEGIIRNRDTPGYHIGMQTAK